MVLVFIHFELDREVAQQPLACIRIVLITVDPLSELVYFGSDEFGVGVMSGTRVKWESGMGDWARKSVRW